MTLARDRQRALPGPILEPMLPHPADRSNRPGRASPQDRSDRSQRHDRTASKLGSFCGATSEEIGRKSFSVITLISIPDWLRFFTSSSIAPVQRLSEAGPPPARGSSLFGRGLLTRPFSATAGPPVPVRRRTTWIPPVGPTAGSGNPRRTEKLGSFSGATNEEIGRKSFGVNSLISVFNWLRFSPSRAWHPSSDGSSPARSPASEARPDASQPLALPDSVRTVEWSKNTVGFLTPLELPHLILR
jgi:hypothetical protein